MTNLVKAEWFKLKRNKSFWVIAGISIGLSALLHYLIIIDWWMISNTVFDRAGVSELNAQSIFITLIFFNLIISPLAGFFISVEFSQSGVIKNQVISGNKRSHIFLAKFLVYSLGSFIVVVLIPVVMGLLLVLLFGNGEVFNASDLMYIARSFTLFTLQLLSYTAIVTILAILTEDSGKTIIISIIFTIVMFAIEKFPKVPFIELLFENSIFYQLSEVFNRTMSTGEILKSIIIGIVSLIIIVLCGIFMMNKKEIK